MPTACHVLLQPLKKKEVPRHPRGTLGRGVGIKRLFHRNTRSSSKPGPPRTRGPRAAPAPRLEQPGHAGPPHSTLTPPSAPFCGLLSLSVDPTPHVPWRGSIKQTRRRRKHYLQRQPRPPRADATPGLPSRHRICNLPTLLSSGFF